MGERNRPLHGHLLTLAALALVCAQRPLHAEDLMGIYRQALQQAPQLRIGEARRHQARASLLPSVAVTAGYANSAVSTVPAVGVPTDPNLHPITSWGPSLTQPLYNGQAAGVLDESALVGINRWLN